MQQDHLALIGIPSDHHALLPSQSIQCQVESKFATAEVGAAEAEDRLLRIADDEQPRRAAGQENPPKDAPLQRIGVLEFIDDAVAIARPQRVEELLSGGIALRVEVFFDQGDHVVEAQQAALPLVVVEVLLQHRDRADFELAGNVDGGVAKVLPPAVEWRRP